MPPLFDFSLFTGLSSDVYWMLEVIVLFVHYSRAGYVITRSGLMLNHICTLIHAIGHPIVMCRLLFELAYVLVS